MDEFPTVHLNPLPALWCRALSVSQDDLLPTRCHAVHDEFLERLKAAGGVDGFALGQKFDRCASFSVLKDSFHGLVN